MTPSNPNWADRTIKALNVISSARYHRSDGANEQSCRSAFDRVKETTDQILLNFRLKRTGKGLQKLFDDLNKSLKLYRKYTSDDVGSDRLADAYKDAFWAWRQLLKTAA